MKSVSIVLSLLLAGSLMASDTDLKGEVEALKKELQELKATLKKTNLEGMSQELKAVKAQAMGNNLKFEADYRFTVDSLKYEHADGTESKNDSLMANRLILGAKYAPRDDLSFISEIAYNKAFGDTANHSQSNTNPGYADFDWVTNENLIDNDLKLKQAYFIYFGNIADTVAYTASVGRRPSVGGMPTNLREDDAEASPLGHGINVEFDGASFRFDLDKVTGIAGQYFKICLGRGLTNAKPRFQMNGADYAVDESINNHPMDLYGFIFVPFDNTQYRVLTSLYWAENLIGYDMSPLMGGLMTDPNFGAAYMAGDYMSGQQMFYGAMQQAMMMPGFGFTELGGYHGGAITLFADGIGNAWSDFLDNTKLFLSYAYSKTDPDEGHRMLGSDESKTGHSWYAGIQIPCMLKSGAKWGFEWNKGSQYWRSFTFGEDTMIGSKLAARGSAHEVYYTFPILGKTLSGQLRYTHIDYDYTGSNSFFGDEGQPYEINSFNAKMMGAVEEASDFRALIRYRY